MNHLKFKSPFTCIVSGPSGSGKTFLVRSILEGQNVTFNRPPNRILWAYGQWQDLYKQPMRSVNVVYHEGLPEEVDIINSNADLIVIDDLMSELTGDVRMTKLFTKWSHHHNIDVVFIVQNVFHNGPEMRTISLNTHYFILLKNPRDGSQVVNLAKQLFPLNTKYLSDAYEDCTRKPFGYILVDCKSDTPDDMRVRSRILPIPDIKGNFSPIVYKRSKSS